MSASDRGLKIVLVSTQRGWGGGEEQARLLAEGLRARGCRCTILARRGGAFAARMAARGLEVETFFGNGRTPAALWQIRRALRRRRPDVLHCNDSHALSAAGLASLGLAIPARVAMRHVCFSVRFAFRFRMLADCVICVSRAVAEACRRDGIPDGRLRIVHGGIDPSRIGSGDRTRGHRALGASDHDLLLVTVAKLTECKGHADLLQALPLVVGKHPEVKAILAGDGELSAALRAQAKTLGIGAHVRFLGHRDDAPDLIHAADLAVLPSNIDALPLTVMDAMLAHVPVVTTTAGGIPELTGSDDPDAEPVAWTVPPRDAKALARAILDAIDSPEERRLRSERAYAHVERLFTADRMVEATLSVYRELLDRCVGVSKRANLG